MIIFSTKYCLTQGITEHDVRECGNGMVAVPKTAKSFEYYLHGEGVDWHRTKEGATSRAEEVRIKKLQSLDKSIKKISAIKF